MLYLPVQATPGDRINFKTRNPFSNVICPLSTFTKHKKCYLPNVCSTTDQRTDCSRYFVILQDFGNYPRIKDAKISEISDRCT